VSGSVTVTIDSNDNPTISIDGTNVGSGLVYQWDTTRYADGSHTIQASAKGNTDTVTVTVSNGGGPVNDPPTASFTYSATNLAVSFTDTSTDTDGSIDSWGWNFGDGATSTAQNPAHTYAAGGTYTVSLTVTDNGGASDTTSRAITVSSGGGDTQKYALIIGISDYEGTSNDLQYCDDDAMDWKSFLEGEGYTVTILTDHQATAANIETALYDLIAAEDGDDYVVLTYSGHGYKDSTYGSCIISYDLYGMSHGYFESFFDTAESQHIYFAFDACQIGDFQGLADTNRVGAFASNRRYSYDGTDAMHNGVFTYYQMEGWDVQGFDAFEDDAAYAVQKMKEWAPRYIKVDPFYVDQFAGAMLP
jgi:PKD repeat protein